MKVRTILICAVVTIGAAGGIGYGAYYAMQGKQEPVEVVPVSNVNTGSWSMPETIYGSVTSQVAQRVMLDEEYPVAEIFVKEGDEVREGTPLFSYDMTLAELELEMEKLTLQTQELSLAKLEKDLEKLKKGDFSDLMASLTPGDFTLTAASDDGLVVEPSDETLPEDTDAGAAADDGLPADGADFNAQDTDAQNQITEDTDSADGAAGAEDPAGDGQGDADSSSGFEIDGIERVDDPSAGSPSEGSEEQDSERFSIIDSVTGYEKLVAAIDELFRAYGEELKADDVDGAIEEAVAYFRKHLADEEIKSRDEIRAWKAANDKVAAAADGGADNSAGADADSASGNPKDGSEQLRVYVIRDAVREALGEEDAQILETYSKKMNAYHARYVEMMISEASALTGDELAQAAERIRSQYEQLDGTVKDEVRNADDIVAIEERAAQSSDQAGDTQDVTGDTQGTDNTGNSGEDTSGENQTTESGTSGESETQAAEPETSGGDGTQATEPDTSGGDETQAAEPETSGGDQSTEAESGQESELQSESESELQSESESEFQSESESELQSESESEAENTMPVSDAVKAFATAVDTIFLEGASPTPEQYRSAIDLYQQYLGVPVADVADLETTAKMEEYILSNETNAYLASQQEYTAEGLQQQYKSLCLAYVKFMVTRMDPKALVRDDLTAASEAYALLGVTWTNELEAAWQTEQAQAGVQPLTEQTEEGAAMTATKNGKTVQSETQAVQTYPSLYDMLTAYNVILLIQEVDTTQAQDVVYAQLQALWDAYSALTDVQKSLVWNMDETMIQLLRQYGLWEDPQTEPTTEPFTEPDWGDGGDYMDDGPDYTAEEIQEMIEEKERDIKDCKLEIRETELSVKKQQRIVDGKVVKSTLDGTVVSIGSADGDSDNDYFVKVANQTGLYAKGVMSELALEKIKVGDKISGMSSMNGMSFTAVIKEISEYPDPDGANMSYGEENTNAAYYPFYALIDEPDGLEEGEAEIQLSETMANMDDDIYLENFYVRKDSSGKPYVYIQGEDKKLKKQFVKTGKSAYGYAIEIVSGLEMTDRIAFPYGEDVVEGAETKEVDMLEAAYQ